MSLSARRWLAAVMVLLATIAASSCGRQIVDASPQRHWTYGNGDFSAWFETQGAHDRQMVVVSSPSRVGFSKSAKFSVGPGDYTFDVSSAIRAEVRATVADSGKPSEGDVQWYSWSTYFPLDFAWDGGSEPFIYTQWHQTGDSGSPNVSLWIADDGTADMRMTVRGGSLDDRGQAEDQVTYSLGPLVRAKWIDHTVRIKWSTSPLSGGVAVWLGTRQVVDIGMATLYVGQSAYFKQGIYAAAVTRKEHSVFFSDAFRGETRESVALPAP